MKYKIHKKAVFYRKVFFTKDEFEPIEARKIDIHPLFTTFYYKMHGMYYLIEARSGSSIGGAREELNDCIEYFLKVLSDKDKGPKYVQKAVRESIETYGLSPLYRKEQ